MCRSRLKSRFLKVTWSIKFTKSLHVYSSRRWSSSFLMALIGELKTADSPLTSFRLSTKSLGIVFYLAQDSEPMQPYSWCLMVWGIADLAKTFKSLDSSSASCSSTLNFRSASLVELFEMVPDALSSWISWILSWNLYRFWFSTCFM